MRRTFGLSLSDSLKTVFRVVASGVVNVVLSVFSSVSSKIKKFSVVVGVSVVVVVVVVVVDVVLFGDVFGDTLFSFLLVLCLTFGLVVLKSIGLLIFGIAVEFFFLFLAEREDLGLKTASGEKVEVRVRTSSSKTTELVVASALVSTNLTLSFLIGLNVCGFLLETLIRLRDDSVSFLSFFTAISVKFNDDFI